MVGAVVDHRVETHSPVRGERMDAGQSGRLLDLGSFDGPKTEGDVLGHRAGREPRLLEGDGYSGSRLDRGQLDHCGTVDADRAAKWPPEAQHQLQQNSASFAGRTNHKGGGAWPSFESDVGE